MPDFAPCLTGDTDHEVHFYAPNNPTTALCGRDVASPDAEPSDREVCPLCAKRLIRHVLKMAQGKGVASISIEVNTTEAAPSDGLL